MAEQDKAAHLLRTGREVLVRGGRREGRTRYWNERRETRLGGKEKEKAGLERRLGGKESLLLLPRNEWIQFPALLLTPFVAPIIGHLPASKEPAMHMVHIHTCGQNTHK